jgi:hypothetical protein
MSIKVPFSKAELMAEIMFSTEVNTNSGVFRKPFTRWFVKEKYYYTEWSNGMISIEDIFFDNVLFVGTKLMLYDTSDIKHVYPHNCDFSTTGTPRLILAPNKDGIRGLYVDEFGVVYKFADESFIKKLDEVEWE